MEHNIVYCTRNLVNDKYYVGVHATDNLNDSYLGSGIALNRAIKKYGKENFQRNVIAKCNNFEDALNLEKFIVDEEFINLSESYNAKVGGWGGAMSPESAKVVSEKLKGRIKSKEWRDNLAKAQTGKKLSDETKAKMSAKRAGRKLSESHKAAISAGNKGKKKSTEHCENIAASRKGKKLSKEHKAAIAAAGIGRTPTEETRKKLSAARKEWWRKKKLLTNRTGYGIILK